MNILIPISIPKRNKTLSNSKHILSLILNDEYFEFLVVIKLILQANKSPVFQSSNSSCFTSLIFLNFSFEELDELNNLHHPPSKRYLCVIFHNKIDKSSADFYAIAYFFPFRFLRSLSVILTNHNSLNLTVTIFFAYFRKIRNVLRQK